MEESSRNFYAPSDYRKFWATFASLKRYFTENSPWVPLIVKSVANTQRKVWAELSLAKTSGDTPVHYWPFFWRFLQKFDWSVIFSSRFKYGTCENECSQASDKANI